jgi:hypothetical protein
MSDIAFAWAEFVKADRIENDCIDSDAACCVNPGCGNVFDPTSEGFNGECDDCAALAADHFTGAHRGMEVDCVYCWAEPAGFQRSLVAAA